MNPVIQTIFWFEEKFDCARNLKISFYQSVVNMENRNFNFFYRLLQMNCQIC